MNNEKEIKEFLENLRDDMKDYIECAESDQIVNSAPTVVKNLMAKTNCLNNLVNQMREEEIVEICGDITSMCKELEWNFNRNPVLFPDKTVPTEDLDKVHEFVSKMYHRFFELAEEYENFVRPYLDESRKY
jgi:hypothetical protein